MKKTVLILVIALVAGLSFYTIEAAAQMGPQGGYGGWYCPWCGQYMGGYGMGPGMMGPGGGYGMGPGMMGPHMRGRGGMGPGMMGPGYGPQYGPQYPPQYQQPQKPMEEKDARGIVGNYLASTRNPNLKLGKIEDKGNVFEAEILTKDNSLVDKIMVDKNTGWMRSIY